MDASVAQGPNLERKFDAFRSFNPAPAGRYEQIGSSLVKTILPIWSSVIGVYPNVTYDWTSIDSQVQPISDEGASVIASGWYMDPALGPDPLGPPNDWNNWEEYNYQFALHLNSTFGVTYFEIWNEPDEGIFWSGSQADYYTLYEYAVRGIKRAVPEAQVGGPGYADKTGGYSGFFDYVNVNGLPLDFFSYHAQNNGYTDTGGKYFPRYQLAVQLLDDRGMTDVPLIVTEFSYELDPSEGSNADKSYAAAWFAGTFKNVLVNTPRLVKINKTIIDNGTGSWPNNGLIDTTEIPKAKFNLFRMYTMMPYEGIACVSSSGNCMASRSEDTVGVMVWRKDSASDVVGLTVENIPFSLRRVETYLIDSTHSSHFDDDTTNELELINEQNVNGTSFSDSFTLDGYSVVLYLLKGTGSAGDRDNDGDVDIDDFTGFASCFSGPSGLPGFVIPSQDCVHSFDFDADDDVDLMDFAGFQQSFTGSE